jgi:hypothetical protein
MESCNEAALTLDKPLQADMSETAGMSEVPQRQRPQCPRPLYADGQHVTDGATIVFWERLRW